MTTQEHAAKLRQLADDLDPPPKPIRLASGDMTLDMAGRIVKALHTTNYCAPFLRMTVWLHYDTPKVEWQTGAGAKSGKECGTLREAVASLQETLNEEVPGTVENAAEVLAEATEQQILHDEIGEGPAEAELVAAAHTDEF